MEQHHHPEHPSHSMHHGVYEELFCHLPYAIFSVAFGLVVLSFVSYFSFGVDSAMMCRSSKVLFHSFHFMHIAFAATGTIVTFFRFSRSKIRALILGIVSPTIFCTLSDSILPYIGGRMLGVSMKFHLCFLTELSNVIPFLVVGIINGFVMSSHHANKQNFYSLSSHAVHILISSLASIFYLVSQGCTDWNKMIGMIFVYMIIAVVLPCTLSDVVVPIMFAKVGKSEHKKH